MPNEFKVKNGLLVSGSANINASGSEVFSVDGTSGRLFQIDDSLSGSLFSVNTAAGLPVIEAFSDNTVRIGQFGQRAFFVSQSRVGIGLENPTTLLHISGSTGGLFEIDSNTAPNTLYVSSSGNVGIGTNTPIYKLDVSGTSRLAGDTLINSANGLTVSTTVSSTPAVLNAGGSSTAVLELQSTSARRFRLLSTSATTTFEATNTSGFVMNSNLNVQGNVTGSSFTGSFVGPLLGTASFALTASSADDFNVRNSLTASNALISNTLTAQTIVVQTITSSVDFVTGSTKFGSLSSNTHQFTGSVSISGSLTLPYLSTGSVLFVGTNGAISQNNSNFFWDNTNGRLGINNLSPSERLDVNGVIKAWTRFDIGQYGLTQITGNELSYLGSGANGFQFRNREIQAAIAGTYYNLRIQDNIAPTTGTAIFNLLDINATINQTGGSSGIIRGLYINPTLTAAANFRSIEWSTNSITAPSQSWGLYGAGSAPNYLSGSLLIGSTANSGERLQVSGSSKFAGDMVITGSGATSATFALTVQNSNGANILRTRSDGAVYIESVNSVAQLFFSGNDAQIQRSTSGLNGLAMYGPANASHTLAISSFNSGNYSNGALSSLIFSGNFVSTTGNTAFSYMLLNGTINQTGTSISTIRGLYINPTLTAATDFRAIEWSNNASTVGSGSWGLYGSGSAPNYLSGSLSIGTTITGSNALTVSGSVSVIGNTILRGSGSSSTTTGLTIQNSGGTNLFRVRNDGLVFFGTQDTYIFPTADGTNPSTSGRGLIIATNAAGQTGAGILKLTGGYSATSGNDYGLWVSHIFTNGAGNTATHNTVHLQTTINQTGGASGITRGLYVNPILTAATDWRSVEWTNNSSTVGSGSWGLYGSGSAPNYLSGSLSIGTTITGSNALTVSGSANIIGGGLSINAPGSSNTTFANAGQSVYNTYSPTGFNSWLIGVETSYFAVYSGRNILYINRNRTLDAYINTDYFYFGNTIQATAQVDIAGSTTTRASLRIRSGSAPTSPNDGDIWYSGSQMVFRSGINLSGSAVVSQALTSSQALISGSGTQRLVVVGSGSAQPLFTVQGSQGELFSIVDSLSGSLFSVNDQSGLPIMEVFSDNTILMGNYLDPMLLTTTRTGSAAGINTIYSLPTSSYDAVYLDYTIRSGSNARAGNFMAMWSGTSVNFTDTSITEFGSTSTFTFGAHISGANMVVTGSAPTAGWTIKSIVKAI